MAAVGDSAPAVAAGVAYAVTDELHQHFVRGRHASPVDVVIDTAGVAAGIYLYKRLFQPRPVPSTGRGS